MVSGTKWAGRRCRPTGSAPWLYAFYGAALALLAACGASLGLGPLYYLGLAAAGLLLLWQVAAIDLDDPDDCLAKFKSNRLFGWLVLGAIVAGRTSSGW